MSIPSPPSPKARPRRPRSADSSSMLKASESGSSYTHDPYGLAFAAADASSRASSDGDGEAGPFLVVRQRSRRSTPRSVSSHRSSNADAFDSTPVQGQLTPTRSWTAQEQALSLTVGATRSHLTVTHSYRRRSVTPPHDSVGQKQVSGRPPKTPSGLPRIAVHHETDDEAGRLSDSLRVTSERNRSLNSWIAEVSSVPVVRFHEEALSSCCEYTVVPSTVPTPSHWPSTRVVESDGSTHRVFLGQVPFATTPEQVAFVLETVCLAVPAFVAAHRCGCFVAHYTDPQLCDAVVAFNKRIYFDRDGVWVARDDAGKTAISAEVEAVGKTPRATELRQLRLPRGAMVMEHFTDADAGNPMRRSGAGGPRPSP